MKHHLKHLWPLLSLLAVVVLAGCSAGAAIVRNYYVLEYADHTEDSKLAQETPIEGAVLVTDTSVPATYDKRRIAVRHFGPRLTYSDVDNWALKPSSAVPRLVAMRFNRYHIFQQTTRGFLADPPPYEVRTTLHNVELFRSEFIEQAHVKMEFQLIETETGEVLVRHTFDREETLLSRDMDTFVQVVDEMILAETDKFIQLILIKFKGGGIKPLQDLVNEVTEEQDLFVDDQAGNEMGMLLLPSLSQSENEPPFSVIDKYGLEVAGRMGEPLPLLEGFYDIRIGSGDVKQMMIIEDVEIIAGYRRIIEPTWGALIVDMVDVNRDFAEVSYEIFRLDSAESYGSEYPADVSIGEQQHVWVLEPGFYKVTINNEPFNTYKDFTTVLVEEGKLQTLTIVVNLDEEDVLTNLIGAGVLRESELETRRKDYKLSSAIHVNANLNSDNSTDETNAATNFTLTGQLDTRFTWDSYPYHFTSKNLIEIGSTKDEDTDFRVTTDEFTLKNTFIYYVFHSFGFYVRGDIDANLLEQREYSTEPVNYRLIDNDGTIHEHEGVKKVKIRPYLLPLGFKEGVGINWRVFNTPRVNLYARAGFGLRQDINDGVYTATDSDTTGVGWQVFTENENSYEEGLEFSIESDFRLPLNVRLNSNVDVLKPFDKDKAMSYDWENIFNIRLVKQLSIDYKLLATYDKDDADWVIWNHTLYLRFTYFLY